MAQKVARPPRAQHQIGKHDAVRAQAPRGAIQEISRRISPMSHSWDRTAHANWGVPATGLGRRRKAQRVPEHL